MSCRLVKRYMGGSTSFNGTTSTIPTDITSNDVFTSGNGFTLWRWIKPKSYGEIAGRIFDKTTNAATADGFRVVLGSSYSIEFNINGGTQRDSAARAIKINQWTLALVTVAPDATVTHYINGVVSGTPGTTGALSGITTANPLTIGNRSTATDRTFDGLMGEGGIVPRVLTQAEITALYTAGILPADTAHFFPLSDLPSTYLDTIGGATGTGTATTYSPDVPVQLPVMVDEGARSSLSFDGSGDYINLGATTQLNVFTSVTITQELLLKTYSACGTFIKGRGGATGYAIKIGATGLIGFTKCGIADYASTYKMPLNTFKKISLKILSDNTADLWVAGQHVFTFTNTTAINASTNNAYIGTDIDGAGNAIAGFIGIIKSTRGHSTALTDQQIRDLHFNNIVPTEGLVLNLELNEGAGTTAYDSSGNGNDGTITGATWSAVVPSKAREVIGGNLVKNGDLSYQPPFVAETTASNVWIDGSASGSATNNLFGFATYLNGATGSVSFDEAENALKLVRTSTATNNATWVSLRKTFSGAIPLVSELPLLCKIKPNTAYTFRFKRKQDGNLATGQAQYKYQTHSASAVRNINVTVTGNPTTEWVETFVTFTSGASDRYFECAFVNGYTGFTPTAGTIWIKNISLQETTLPTRATATTRTTVTCP